MEKTYLITESQLNSNTTLVKVKLKKQSVTADTNWNSNTTLVKVKSKEYTLIKILK